MMDHITNSDGSVSTTVYLEKAAENSETHYLRLRSRPMTSSLGNRAATMRERGHLLANAHGSDQALSLGKVMIAYLNFLSLNDRRIVTHPLNSFQQQVFRAAHPFRRIASLRDQFEVRNTLQ